LGVPSGPVVATGTVCHSVSRWSSSSGMVTMGDHFTERMSTGHDKPWEGSSGGCDRGGRSGTMAQE
jgi:hypothetical protein